MLHVLKIKNKTSCILPVTPYTSGAATTLRFMGGGGGGGFLARDGGGGGGPFLAPVVFRPVVFRPVALGRLDATLP